MSAAADHARALVIGLGNEFRGDDGAGLLVTAALRRQADAALEVLEQPSDIMALADAWGGRRTWLVDACHSRAVDAGDIIEFDLDRDDDHPWLQRLASNCSSHSLDLAAALALSRALGRAPQSLRVCAIGARHFQCGAPPSAPVQAAAARLAQQLTQQLQACGPNHTEQPPPPCTNSL